ncbi:hypothetical protein [Rhodopseudomonas sp. P2A-2r]|uniref:hypothetical protein n=1 Tax=unclassified Rhodopseudomonas TaxID=2638247 RepID=UPI002234A212|nr:hypothetical protein [Rhodopseudomonas sp. P2A-2r]UZE49933.1 hypothetical protein ONR75_03890 [Rhodopseudomonas sp. P2A-2r]
MARVIATRCYSSRRNNKFSPAGRSSSIDRIVRHTFVKSAKPSSRAAACDTSIVPDVTATIGDPDDCRTTVFSIFDEDHCFEPK